MPLVYDTSLTAAGNSSTSGSINTETDRVSIQPGVRNVRLRAIDLQGMGSGLNLVSGMSFGIVFNTTASTVGTTMTPAPKDVTGYIAALATVRSLPTAGSGRTNRMVLGISTTGHLPWIPRDIDSQIEVPGGSAGSIDMFDFSGLASFPFRWSFEHQE